MAGIEAEYQGLVKKPLERATPEIDFYDANGSPIDVKTPPGGLSFDIYDSAKLSDPQKGLGVSIKKQLETATLNKSGAQEKCKVLLDCTYITAQEHAKLWNWLNSNLTREQLDRIIELNVKL